MMNEYVRRATAAWFKSGGTEQPNNESDLVKHDGKNYVRLVNVNGVLAVYRVRNDDMLRRMKRWPDALNHW
jgi:hypothetical protein